MPRYSAWFPGRERFRCYWRTCEAVTMPFGLDLKSVVLGILFAYFVLPYIIGKINSMRREKTA